MDNHKGQNARLKQLLYWLPLALAVISVPLGFAALVLALDAQGPNTYRIDSVPVNDAETREFYAAAEDTLNQTEQNNNAINNILSFIEGGSILLGGIIALLGATYILNIRDLRADLEQQAAATQGRVESVLRQREEMVDRLSRRLEEELIKTSERITTLTQEIRRQLDEARRAAENSFRVLSLQLLAEQQLRLKNYETAVQTLQDAHTLEPENSTTNYLLGYIYTGRRKFTEAQEHLRTALKANPDFAPALAALGLAQRRMGDGATDADAQGLLWTEAELNLRRALQMDNGLIDAEGESYFGTLGGLYRRQNRYQEAVHAYEKAVLVTPHSPYPIGNLATLYKYTGDNEKASEAFEKVQEIALAIIDDRPGDIWARFDLGQAYLVLGQKNKALQQYRDVIDRRPPVGSLEAALSGLRFLAQSPTLIEGIQDAISLLEKEIEKRSKE